MCHHDRTSQSDCWNLLLPAWRTDEAVPRLQWMYRNAWRSEDIPIELENPLTKRFDRLADGLWLFLDIYDRVRRFGEEVPASTQSHA